MSQAKKCPVFTVISSHMKTNKKSPRGGPRKGAGRKPTGRLPTARQTVSVVLAPSAVASLDALARSKGLTRGRVIEELLDRETIGE